jgi:membrane-associated protease RseP (regulator of RpoE activity)
MAKEHPAIAAPILNTTSSDAGEWYTAAFPLPTPATPHIISVNARGPLGILLTPDGRVAALQPTSAAAAAGVAVGDVLHSVNGTRARSRDEFDGFKSLLQSSEGLTVVEFERGSGAAGSSRSRM